jgi:hypothetical protein
MNDQTLPAQRNTSLEVDNGQARSVYDGQDRLGHAIGHLIQRGTQFTAYGRQGQTIGVFDTMVEAAAAVWRASKAGAS